MCTSESSSIIHPQVSIGAFEGSMYEAISSAVDMLQATQDRVEPAEADRAANPAACNGYRCAPVFEHLFVVTDGRFAVSTELIDGLAHFRIRRPQLQLFGVAVGSGALVAPVKALSCGLDGITFALQPPAAPAQGDNGGAGYASYILNECAIPSAPLLPICFKSACRRARLQAI